MNSKQPLVILDAGHGINTKGKRSPEWADIPQLLEYRFNREIVNRVEKELKAMGIKCLVLVPEIEDVPLSERVKRINAIPGEKFVVSTHVNAAGMGEEMHATGWSVWTSRGNTLSDTLADIFYKYAKLAFPDKKLLSDTTDGDKDFEAGFYILRKSKCPAVLVENFFMDNRKDCAFLQSDAGKHAIISTYVSAINEFIEKIYS